MSILKLLSKKKKSSRSGPLLDLKNYKETKILKKVSM